MKRLRILVGIFIVATFLFGGVAGQEKVFAQTGAGEFDTGAPAESGGGSLISNSGQTAAQTATVAASAPAQDVDVVRGGQASRCSLTSFSLLACVDAFFAFLVTSVALNIAGWFLWVTATMMNYSIDLGILQFSKWAPEALYPIWIIIRQIVSLLVVFAGLYLGFMYVLGKEDTFEKYIPWVIIFALFVNFSYPLVRTAVDVSNVISLNIYASAVGGETLSGTFGSNPNAEQTAGAIIRGKLGLSGLVDRVTGNNQGGTRALENINSTPAALLAVIYILYATYIFFMVSFIIISRTAILVFLIVASPLLLVDTVIPKLGDVASKLRKIFFEQLAVAPVFTIMLALTLKFLDVFQAGGGPLASTNVLSAASTSAVPMFFNMLMMLIMLHIMLKVTKSLAGEFGNYVGNTMGKVGSFATGAAVGLATGGTGLLARASLGRVAANVRDSEWVKGKQDSFIGRRVYDMSNAVAKSSFDMSNSTLIAGGAQKLGISGMSMGMGSKMLGGKLGGYDGESEAKAKGMAERGNSIKIKHTEDKYEVNERGESVLVGKKGDVDEKATMDAKTRFYNSAGGSVFMNDEQKKRTRELIKENLKKNSGDSPLNKDIKAYDDVKDVYDEKGNVVLSKDTKQKQMLVETENKLKQARLKDPDGLNLETQQLQETANHMRSKQVADRATQFNNATGTEVEVERKRHDILQILQREYDTLTKEGDQKTQDANRESADQILKTIDELRRKQASDAKAVEARVQGYVARHDAVETQPEKDKVLSRIDDADILRKVKGRIQEESDAKVAVYGQAQPQKRQDMYAYDLTEKERTVARDADHAEALRENATVRTQPTIVNDRSSINNGNTVTNNTTTINNEIQTPPLRKPSRFSSAVDSANASAQAPVQTSSTTSRPVSSAQLVSPTISNNKGQDGDLLEDDTTPPKGGGNPPKKPPTADSVHHDPKEDVLGLFS